MKQATTQQAVITQAIALLRTGKLVALPTETVYGLAADATNPEAVAKIFAVKGRPTSQPLPVLIPKDADLRNWAINIPTIAYKLAEAFWPGPLTLILPCAQHINKVITGGRNTIGLRSPNHPLTQQILTAFPHGLATPSANLYGHPPPTCAAEVNTTLGNKIDLIVDGGPCQIGMSSTIVDLTAIDTDTNADLNVILKTKLKILRQGTITFEEIVAALL